MSDFAFEDARWLLLGLIALPLAWLAFLMLRDVDRVKRYTAIVLRIAVLAVLCGLVAEPLHRSHHDALTVVTLFDVSESMHAYSAIPDRTGTLRTGNLDALRQWLIDATESRRVDDRFGMILFAGESMVVRAPSQRGTPDIPIDAALPSGTNIAEAIRLGLALLPSDTAKRLLLVSDGNETVDDALEAARLAVDVTSGETTTIPIDVLPIDFQEVRDVRMVRIDAPPSGRPGQRVRLRIVMESTHATSGRLVVRQEGRPIDLNPASRDFGRQVRLAPGTTIETVDVELAAHPVNRFEATIEPNDPQLDLVRTNNRASAFTVTPSGGSVLIVRQNPSPGLLDFILSTAQITTEVITPEDLPSDLLDLQNADLVVLENVAASRFSEAQMRALVTHVTDFGGGLLMTGGYEGFGAGAWQNTPVGDILPLELNPPRELRAPQAALVFVIDVSGSMNFPVSGARATQMDLAITATNRAIDSLQDETLVGIVTFSTQASTVLPLQRLDDRGAVRARVESIRAGGGTHIGQGLRAGIDMLRVAETERRIMVLLSDGVSMGDDYDEILDLASKANIQLSTIAIGDQTDLPLLRRLADDGGGEFLTAINPRTLPRVLVDSVRVVNRPLIREGTFTPVVLPTGSQLTAPLTPARALQGLVITAPLDDPRATIDLIHPDGEPIFASWQRGLGRIAAFTGELDGAWSDAWRTWPAAESFWVELVRTLARPASRSELEVIVRARSGALDITMLVDDLSDGLDSGLTVTGTVYAPNGQSTPIRLTEVVPGRYTTEHRATEVGPYIVALTPRRGMETMAPVLGGGVVEAHAELARTTPDHQLLERIAELTGGRRLNINNPSASDLFDREGLPGFSSFQSLHTPLLSLLIAVLLLDIAARRIAWRGADITATGQRLVRSEPAAADTRSAATLLRRGQGGRPKRTAPPPKSAPIRETVRPLRSVPMVDHAKRESPEQAAADDARPEELAGQGSSGSDADPANDQTDGGTGPGDPPSNDAMRSGLRAARDRARKRFGPGPPDPDRES